MLSDIVLTDALFYSISAIIVAGAVSVVTIRSPKGAVVAFAIFCLSLGGLFFAMSLSILAIAQAVIGFVALAVYQIKFGKTGERADDKVKMIYSPNQSVAIFLLLCFMIAMTPVWIYSVWSPQPGNNPENLDSAVLSQITGQYLPTLIGIALAFSVVALFALHIRRLKAERVLSASSHMERV